MSQAERDELWLALFRVLCFLIAVPLAMMVSQQVALSSAISEVLLVSALIVGIGYALYWTGGAIFAFGLMLLVLFSWPWRRP